MTSQTKEELASPAYRHVCFDLDLTLIDDEGTQVRPGILELLSLLRQHGVTLSIWSWSTTERAQEIIERLGLRPCFDQMYFREDWPEVECPGPKEIGRIGAEFMVDDSPLQIQYQLRSGRGGFLVTPFIDPSAPVPPQEMLLLQHILLPNALYAARQKA